MKFKFVWSILSFFLLVESFSFCDEISLLKTDDVHKIMEQILSQHAEKNKMTGDLIKNSLKIYIEQFDPYRTYLLRSEVNPYINLSEKELEDLRLQYAQNNYSVYNKLNDLFVKAIIRNRNFRDELEKNNASLFKHTLKLTPDEIEKLLLNKSFATNEEELKKRVENQLIVLFQAEKRRYGDAYVFQNQKPIFDIYQKRLKVFENQYLFDHDNKDLLSQSEKENLFVMHILKSLASSLDAHTEFFNPAEANDMKMHLQNSFQGVGLSLQDSPEGIIVSGLIPGSPAAKSGLVRADDQIIEIDGKNISEMNVDNAANLLKGQENTPVTLLIKRKIMEGAELIDKQLNVTLKREPITIDEDRVLSTFEHFGNGIIGKIRLNSFYQNDQGVTSEKDVKDALEKLEKSGNLRGVVLDLRENTGGFLSQAVKVAGLFITNGVVVISKYSNGDERFFRDMDGKVSYEGPLVILTSKMTASAAEIVAESLQDYGIAIIVGDERTYGKGTVQTQTVTQDKASSFFKVTIGKYYTVSGNTPQIKGVLSDVVVPGKYSNEDVGEAYLGAHTLQNDKIEPAFEDKLEDIDKEAKPWYLHYYVPTEQQKVAMWRDMIPILKKNSGYRILQNKNYQTFLKRLKGEREDVDLVEEEYLIKPVKNFGNEDLQMIEAVNVLKDMIYLESKVRVSEKK